MKRFLLAWWLLSLTAYSAWIPPENPEPKVILKEAKEDTKEGRYEDALAKHLWFFQNALTFDKAQYGVRLSFALADWRRLAAEYPPAMEALRTTRDATEDEIRAAKPAKESSAESDQNNFQQFHDLVALNGTLRETIRTAALFQWLDEHQPERAQQVFPVAERALVEAGEYKLCGKYLEPEKDFAQLAQTLTMHREMADQKRFVRMREFGEQTFSYQAATLVGLLVLNDRPDEAKTVRDRAAELWDAKAFQEKLDAALEGKLPPPYPSSRE